MARGATDGAFPCAFDFPRPPAGEVLRLAAYSAATIHEATGLKGALPSAIRPIDRAMRLCGPALTVFCPAGDNLMIHAAIEGASPGDVLVVDHEGAMDDGPFGDVLAAACRARGIAGLVIDGCVRDAAELRAMGFPVFARGLCIRGTTKRRFGSVGQDIRIADASIRPGDVLVGDEDGLVVVARSLLSEAIAASALREAREGELREALRAGASTVDLLGLRETLATKN
jgi:4-hydroxy-4-methyl-2-oxoglutarate aldolase